MTEQSMRPGIYVDYEISSLKGAVSGKTVGIVAQGIKEGNRVFKAESLEESRNLFGPGVEENPLGLFAALLFAEGVSSVWGIIPEGDGVEQYQRAFDLLLAADGAEMILSDSGEEAFYQYEKTRLLSLGEKKIGKYLILPAQLAESAERAVEIANTMNCERICMAYPKVRYGQMDISQVILAAMLAHADELAGNLNGTVTAGTYEVASLTEEAVNQLIRNGVCVLEGMGNLVTLIRGVTTRIRNEEGEKDLFYRNLSVPMISDRVVLELRTLLLERIQSSPGGETALSTLASLLIGRLEELKEEGLISSYTAPSLRISEEDAGVCMAEVGFTISQWFSQIYLQAHITV